MNTFQEASDVDVISADEIRYKYEQAFITWIKRSKNIFVQFDRNFRIIYANPAFCRTTSVSQDLILGTDLAQFGLEHEEAEKWRSALHKTLTEGKERLAELWLPTVNGLRCFRLRFVAVFHMGDGAIESLWVNGRDITEVRGAQNALGETETRFKAIVSNIPGVVFQLSLRQFDNSLEFHYVSDGVTALCGITPERMLLNSAGFIELINGDDQVGFYQSMRLSMGTLANWAWEGRLSGSMYGERWVSLRATPRRNSAGSILWDGIILDVTDSRRNAEKLRQSEEFLRDLCVRVSMVREEEKRTISREIHDELGQLLTVLKLDFSCMREGDGLNDRGLSRLERMEGVADDILRQVRDIASTLRPKVLDLGLAPAIEWLAQEFTCRNGIVCRLSLDVLDCCNTLKSTDSTAIFRIVQESLTNVARHANARHVDILFTKYDQGLRLLIQDDGIGFDLTEVRVNNGLSGIRERAVILGADLEIDSSEERGTCLEVLIPVEFNDTHNDEEPLVIL